MGLRKVNGTNYAAASNYEKRKLEEGYERLEDYEEFYLYGKFHDGKLLYKECFSKFDIDGVPWMPGDRKIYKFRGA